MQILTFTMIVSFGIITKVLSIGALKFKNQYVAVADPITGPEPQIYKTMRTV